MDYSGEWFCFYGRGEIIYCCSNDKWYGEVVYGVMRVYNGDRRFRLFLKFREVFLRKGYLDLGVR